MSASTPITLSASAADKIGKRLIVAHEGERELHRDKLDPDSAYHRAQFADALWLKAYGSEPDDAERVSVGNAILAAVAEAGANKPTSVAAPSDNDDSCKESIAEKLVRLALGMYRFGRTEQGEPFAVALDGANIAIMLRGSGDALRARLAKEFRREHKRTPTSSALADALMVLQGEALDAEAEPVALRLTEHASSIVIDLGDAEGRAVVVSPQGWQVVERSPVLFRRTALTGAMPLPERGGSLDALRDQINVTDENWPLLVGWLVAALLPSIPHAILLLTGIQGAAKSSTARVLVSLTDPASVDDRKGPSDVDQWVIAASGSWVVSLDNLSAIPDWLSDALCRAVTGDGLVKRKLYSDGDLAVIALRRVVIVNGIDVGAIRGDLGERLLLLDLERIDESQRRTEQDMATSRLAARPRIIGALLDALAKVLAELPRVQPAKLPRMADFARVLAACDAAGVTDGAFDGYMAQQGRVAADVLDSDPFAVAVLEFVRARGSWCGIASELLTELLPQGADKPPRDWPKRNGVKGKLKRLLPALAEQGVVASFDREGATRERRRLIHLANKSTPENIVRSVRTVQELPPDARLLDESDDSDDQIGHHRLACDDANDLFSQAAEADRSEVTL